MALLVLYPPKPLLNTLLNGYDLTVFHKNGEVIRC